jgi:hypothetical protein
MKCLYCQNKLSSENDALIRFCNNCPLKVKHHFNEKNVIWNTEFSIEVKDTEYIMSANVYGPDHQWGIIKNYNRQFSFLIIFKDNPNITPYNFKEKLLTILTFQ